MKKIYFETQMTELPKLVQTVNVIGVVDLVKMEYMNQQLKLNTQSKDMRIVL